MTRTTFPTRFAAADCGWLTRCDDHVRDMLYADAKDCRATTRDDVTRTSDCMAQHCTFDAAAATGCVSELSKACDVATDPTPAACAVVWVACDGGEAECAAAEGLPD